jgi:hypothetical protein
MNQKELKEYMYSFLVEYYGVRNVYSEEGFIFVKGDLPVTLVAHLDTVHEVQVSEDTIVVNDNIVSSPVGIGGDDRCGVYAIKKLVELGLKPTIVLTEDEEIGCIGARTFSKNHQYLRHIKECNFIVELDRKGRNDAVFYDCHNEFFKDYIISRGWEYNTGSCSDICYIAPITNVAAVNLSVGYYNAHTENEYVNFDDLEETILRVKDLLNEQRRIFRKFKFHNNPEDFIETIKSYKENFHKL